MATDVELDSLRQQIRALRDEVVKDRENLQKVRDNLSEETDQRKKEDDQLLQVINIVKQALDQETQERMSRIQDAENMCRKNEGVINEVRLEVQRHVDKNSECLAAINELKYAMDKEQVDATTRLKESKVFQDEARGSIAKVEDGARKQKESHDEHLQLINIIKNEMDKEVTERLTQTTKLDKHVTDVSRECSAQKGDSEELLRVVNELKDTFDREQYQSVQQHCEVLKCIEDTAEGKREASLERVRKLRSDGTSRASSRPRQVTVVEDAPLVSTSSNEDLSRSLQAALDAVEKEKSERTASLGHLQSHITNFQNDFVAERSEHCQLRGDVTALKAEMVPQMRNLKQDLDLMTQELRALRSSSVAESARPQSAAFSLSDVRPSTSQLDIGAIKDTVRDEVLQAFSEHQARHRDLLERINLASSQEKSDRVADISRIQDIVQGLGRKIELQALSNMGDRDNLNPYSKAVGQDFTDNSVSRDEFESQFLRLWDAIGTDASIPRDEFEGNLQRIWEAIMHLQAKQLEDLKVQTRETAFSNGMSGLGEVPHRSAAPLSTAASSPMGYPSTVSASSSIAPRSPSGNSPMKGVGYGRKTLPSSQRPTSPGGSSSTRFTAPFLSETLLPTSGIPLSPGDSLQIPLSPRMRVAGGRASPPAAQRRMP